MNRTLRLISLLILALLLGSCSNLDYTVTRRSAIDAQIAAARVDTEQKLKALDAQQVGLLRQSITQYQSKLQDASNYLFLGSATFSTLKTPTRPEFVMGHSIEQTAAQLPPAAPDVQAATFKQMQVDLDEAKTTNAQLQARYDTDLTAAKTEAAIKQAAIGSLNTQLSQVEQDRLKVLADANQKEAALSDARKAIDDKDLATKQKAIDDAKHNDKIKMWLIGILLTAAAAAGITAAFIPIPTLKPKLIIGAAICGGAAILIPFIEPYMVGIALGVILILLVGWVLFDYYHTHSDATDTYRALNEVKVKAADTFDKVIAPILQQWHTNPTTTQRIDATLKQVGDT